MRKTPAVNHVIFLGAGASFTSGYPIGTGLRLRMSCPSHLGRELLKVVREETSAHTAAREFFSAFSDAIRLFRKGGFGTVDEFSRLAAISAPEHVQDMKRLMRLIFALHNPEEAFHESDYYPFIQRLFDGNLYELKRHITLITFNYDCYLEYLLLTAFHERQKLTENGSTVELWKKNKLTGGFWKPSKDLDWAAQNLGFNLFKLHGSIAYGGDEDYGFNALFGEEHDKRLLRFRPPSLFQSAVPPIVFPWEVFDEKGFVDEKEFIFTKHAEKPYEAEQAKRLFNQLKASWESAREVVGRANKISFVGLSMHSYLEPGFAFLFGKLRNKKVQVVVANKDNENFRDTKQFHRLSPCSKVASLLNRLNQGIQWTCSTADHDGTIDTRDLEDDNAEPDMTARYSFREFIETELD